MKSLLLASSFLAAVTGITGQAAAQQTIYGNGSSAAAPFWRSALNCAGTDTALVTRTGSAVAAGTPVTPFVWDPDTNGDGIANNDGAPPSNGYRAGTLSANNTVDCALETANQVTNFQGVYVSTGSGRGIQGVFSHSPSFAGDYVVGNGTTELFPAQHYGISEIALESNDVENYNLGTDPDFPLTQGLTILPPGDATPDPLPSNTFRNPRERYGALVQFPLLIAPVNIAFDPIYRKYNHPTLGLQEYRLRIQNPRTVVDANGNTVTTGGIRLTPSAYCRIFHGEITNWNDIQLRHPAVVGNAQTLRDQNDVTQTNANFSAPIQIVGHADSSGTTWIFTRHLAAACDAFVATNAYGTRASDTLPTALLSGAVYQRGTGGTAPAGEVSGRFTLASGSEGVSEYLDFTQTPTPGLRSPNDSGKGFIFNAGINPEDVLTQARIGYLAPPHVLPGVLTTQTNDYQLNTADLYNGNGRLVSPSPANARLAYEQLVPVVSDGVRQFPERWVEGGSENSVLAFPQNAAYPIVGTTNALLYTCYSAGSARAGILRFMQFYLFGGDNSSLVHDNDQGLLDSAGLSLLPSGWRNAIRTVFFTSALNSGNPNGQAIQATVNADGNGTVLNEVTGQQVPESTQCQGLVGAGA